MAEQGNNLQPLKGFLLHSIYAYVHVYLTVEYITQLQQNDYNKINYCI